MEKQTALQTEVTSERELKEALLTDQKREFEKELLDERSRTEKQLNDLWSERERLANEKADMAKKVDELRTASERNLAEDLSLHGGMQNSDPHAEAKLEVEWEQIERRKEELEAERQLIIKERKETEEMVNEVRAKCQQNIEEEGALVAKHLAQMEAMKSTQDAEAVGQGLLEENQELGRKVAMLLSERGRLEAEQSAMATAMSELQERYEKKAAEERSLLDEVAAAEDEVPQFGISPRSTESNARLEAIRAERQRLSEEKDRMAKQMVEIEEMCKQSIDEQNHIMADQVLSERSRRRRAHSNDPSEAGSVATVAPSDAGRSRSLQGSSSRGRLEAAGSEAGQAQMAQMAQSIAALEQERDALTREREELSSHGAQSPNWDASASDGLNHKIRVIEADRERLLTSLEQMRRQAAAAPAPGGGQAAELARKVAELENHRKRLEEEKASTAGRVAELEAQSRRSPGQDSTGAERAALENRIKEVEADLVRVNEQKALALEAAAQATGALHLQEANREEVILSDSPRDKTARPSSRLLHAAQADLGRLVAEKGRLEARIAQLEASGPGGADVTGPDAAAPQELVQLRAQLERALGDFKDTVQLSILRIRHLVPRKLFCIVLSCPAILRIEGCLNSTKYPLTVFLASPRCPRRRPGSRTRPARPRRQTPSRPAPSPGRALALSV